MPRTPPELTLIDIPEIKRGKPLSQMYNWATLLGFSRLKNDAAEDLSHDIALAEAGRDVVAGLGRKRTAATLKRFAKKLRREQQTGVRNEDLRRLMANPHLGMDTDSSLMLARLAKAPASQLLAAIETRQRELERAPRKSPQREALESGGGAAVWFFLLRAGDNVRDEPGAWWKFVLAFLHAASFPIEKLSEHPESLRPMLEEFRVAAEPLAGPVRAALSAGMTLEEIDAKIRST